MIDDLATDDTDEELDEVSEDDDDGSDGSDSPTDNVGDPSVEINVEDLINELESAGLTKGLGSCQDARKRLEELMERKRARRELEDFDDYDI